MNANELMRENYVKETATNRIGTILYVDFNKTKIKLEYSTLFCPIQAIEPIPLTEKWLLDFGFFKHNNAWVLQKPTNNYLKFNFSIWEDLTYNTAEIKPDISNVHQLQNLYFALTGNPLQLV